MRRGLISISVTLFAVCLSVASARAQVQDDVDQAVTIIRRFQEIPEQAIPEAVLRDAQGIAVITMTKAGFIFTGRGGRGIVVARTESGWSGPSAIGTGGIGFGFQIGVEVAEYVIILNTREAVNAFAGGGNLTLGGNISAALGPVGRSAEAGVAVMAATYTYSRSQGLFAGVSLEGTVIATRYEDNEYYYGEPVNPGDILSGRVAPPPGAKKLLDVLAKY